MKSVANRSHRILAGRGNSSARTLAAISGGITIWTWCGGKQTILLPALPVEKSSWSTGIATESSAPMTAILLTGLEVFAMDKKTFQQEVAFQVTLHLARKMLAKKLITEKEYHDFERDMLRRYQPFSGDLFTC